MKLRLAGKHITGTIGQRFFGGIPLSPRGSGWELRSGGRVRGHRATRKRAWKSPTTHAVFQPQTRLAPHPALRATLSRKGRGVLLETDHALKTTFLAAWRSWREPIEPHRAWRAEDLSHAKTAKPPRKKEIIELHLFQAHRLRGFVSLCEALLAWRVWLALIDSHEDTKATKKEVINRSEAESSKCKNSGRMRRVLPEQPLPILQPSPLHPLRQFPFQIPRLPCHSTYQP